MDLDYSELQNAVEKRDLEKIRKLLADKLENEFFDFKSWRTPPENEQEKKKPSKDEIRGICKCISAFCTNGKGLVFVGVDDNHNFNGISIADIGKIDSMIKDRLNAGTLKIISQRDVKLEELVRNHRIPTSDGKIIMIYEIVEPIAIHCFLAFNDTVYERIGDKSNPIDTEHLIKYAVQKFVIQERQKKMQNNCDFIFDKIVRVYWNIITSDTGRSGGTKLVDKIGIPKVSGGLPHQDIIQEMNLKNGIYIEGLQDETAMKIENLSNVITTARNYAKWLDSAYSIHVDDSKLNYIEPNFILKNFVEHIPKWVDLFNAESIARLLGAHKIEAYARNQQVEIKIEHLTYVPNRCNGIIDDSDEAFEKFKQKLLVKLG